MAQKSKNGVKSRFLENKYIYLAQMLLALIIMADYTLTDNISHVLGNWYYLLPIAGVTLGILPLLRQWKLYKHKYLVLSVGYFMTGLFLIFLTDVFGPYFQILILLLFSSIYWFGLMGLIFGLAAQSFIVLLGAWYQYETLDNNLAYTLLIHFLVLVVLGVLFERVSLKRRLEVEPSRRLTQTISFERTRLLSLINSMADAVIATDQNGKILLYNGAALDLINTNASLEDHLISEFIDFKDSTDRSVDILNVTKKAGRAVKRDDLYFISNEKQKVRLYIDVAPIYSGGNNSRWGGYIILLRDITKEKSLDEERSEFISVTSHELRTPIAIVEANISTALLPDAVAKMPPTSAELLKQAHNQVVFLGDLVNDLTTLARAERGDLEPDINPINTKTILEKLAENYRQEADRKGLKLTVDPQITEHVIQNSELYIREILQNFITNALKYTPKGEIVLSAKGKGSSAVFTVKDSGVGISNTDKKKIFTKFYRAEDYRTRETRGTGLGLYITRKLVEKIRGKIWFKSVLNKGSIFFLEVPTLHPARRKSLSEKY